MTHGSLFSGIGGFDLAAEWMGWENKFHCEWNPFGQKVLKYYWPEAESFEDITKTDFTKYANTIDILTGGFPCQPYSLAGKRKGKEDDRHLWPEMLRCIGEVKPRWVIGENVLGLVNWNGGLVFHEVQSDLEAKGFEVWPYVLPAASVNAPHRRDRVWFVAHSKDNGRNGRKCEQWQGIESDKRDICEREAEGRNEIRTEFERHSQVGTFTNSEHIRCHTTGKDRNISEKKREKSKGRNQSSVSIKNGNGNGDASDTNNTRFKTFDNQKSKLGPQNRTKTFGRNSFESIHSRNWWETFPTVSPICNGDDGISDRLDGITFSKWRNESIKAGGNAIVPQVAFQIFKTIEQYERLH